MSDCWVWLQVRLPITSNHTQRSTDKFVIVFPLFSLQACWILVEQGPVSALLQWAWSAGLLLWGDEELCLPCGASHLPGSHTLHRGHLILLLLLLCHGQRNPLRSLSPWQHPTSWFLQAEHCCFPGPLSELGLGHARCWGSLIFLYVYVFYWFSNLCGPNSTVPLIIALSCH